MFGIKHESATSIAAFIAVSLLVVDIGGVSASSSVRSARRLLFLDTDRGWNAAYEGPRISGRVGDGEGTEFKGRGFEAGNSDQDFAFPEFGGDEDPGRNPGRGRGNGNRPRRRKDQHQDTSKEEGDELPVPFADFLMRTFFP
ncbi:hypothetical protein BSKO_03056 [Bryopsis sp. KO-2023]|nr:hypothetical protein BSKO_03056 [Bryopsis sp. KO-2023]